MNKESELFYLERFKENFPSFPAGIISPDERPDFLVKTSNGIIGIEITDFYREKSSDAPLPLQKREGVRRKIISLAKSIYDNKGLPPVYVTIQFDLNFFCQKSEMPAVSERLVELAEQSLSNLAEGKVWRIYDIQLNGIHSLSIEKRESEKSNWFAPLVSFVPTANPQQIQEILDEKNTHCEDYRKRCDKIWLVIVMDRFKASSFSIIQDTTLEHLYAYCFDSAFLFFYERDDFQKPPTLLQKL